jgi:hypothetical protein
MNLQEKIDQAVARFKERSGEITKDIENEAEDIGDSADVLADSGKLFRVKVGEYVYNFEYRKIIFDVPYPDFNFVEEKISLSVPQVTMKDEKYSYDVPYTIMKDKKVGSIPDTKCKTKWKKDDFGIPYPQTKCTTTMKDIIISVPEVHTRTEEIITSIPHIKFEQTDITLHVPQVTVTMKRIVMHAPVVTQIDYEGEEEVIEEASDQIEHNQMKLEKLRAEFDQEIETLTRDGINEAFDKAINDLTEAYRPIQEEFQRAIRASKDAIKALKAKGASDALAAEEKKLSESIDRMKLTLTPMEQQLAQIGEQREEALAKVGA